MPTPIAPPIILSQTARTDLQAVARAYSTPQSLVLRARIVLRATELDRPTNLTIGHELGCSNLTVGKWRRRYLALGLSGLQDARRSGRPPTIAPPTRVQIISVASTLPQDQDRSVTRWTLDELVTTVLDALHTDAVSRSSVWRILHDIDLKPHKSAYWLHSHDEDFAAKAHTICQLYAKALADACEKAAPLIASGAAYAADKASVTPGDNVWVNADVLMTHDVCGPGTIGIFRREFGKQARVWDRESVVLIPDHYIFTADKMANRNVDVLRQFAAGANPRRSRLTPKRTVTAARRGSLTRGKRYGRQSCRRGRDGGHRVERGEDLGEVDEPLRYCRHGYIVASLATLGLDSGRGRIPRRRRVDPFGGLRRRGGQLAGHLRRGPAPAMT